MSLGAAVSRPATTRVRGQAMKVTEGISGYWHYHLSQDGKFTGLCGARTMDTSLKLEDWGLQNWGEHFPKRPTFCKECDRLNGCLLTCN